MIICLNIRYCSLCGRQHTPRCLWMLYFSFSAFFQLSGGNSADDCICGECACHNSVCRHHAPVPQFRTVQQYSAWPNPAVVSHFNALPGNPLFPNRNIQIAVIVVFWVKADILSAYHIFADCNPSCCGSSSSHIFWSASTYSWHLCQNPAENSPFRLFLTAVLSDYYPQTISISLFPAESKASPYQMHKN